MPNLLPCRIYFHWLYCYIDNGIIFRSLHRASTCTPPKYSVDQIHPCRLRDFISASTKKYCCSLGNRGWSETEGTWYFNIFFFCNILADETSDLGPWSGIFKLLSRRDWAPTPKGWVDILIRNLNSIVKQNHGIQNIKKS